MKKILSLFLTIVLCIGLVACGGTSTAPSEVTPVETAPVDIGPVVDTFKIGMVTDVGGVNDKSFNQLAWEGLEALAAEDPMFSVSYLESKTDADYGANIEAFMDEDYDLIICVGYMLADATRAAAEANPNQLFAIIDDASCEDLSNVACLMFAQEQASYLVGVVAGTMTESNVIGYVQGMVSDSMNKFGVGFVSGVLSVNPEAQIIQYNANNFGDAAGGKGSAQSMITSGADIIYHAAGGTGNGVIEACKENGIYAIGVDSDQSVLAPETVVTSAMKRVDVASQDIAKSVRDGQFVAGIHLYDLSNQGVDLAPTQTLLTQEALDAVAIAKAGILDGTIVVPTAAEEVPQFTLN